MTHRNGYRPRAWETRVGEIELLIPSTRSGPAYFPSFLEPRRRCEQAIVAVVMEAYVNGVSDPQGRPARRAARHPGHGQGPRQPAVPRAGRARRAVPQRPLEGAYPYLWLDAKHLKVRDRGRVVSKALVIAYAVHETGRREVIGLDLGEVESEAFWTEFLRALRSRGLDGLRLVVSDHHEGLKTAIARVLDAPWQRCCVHFVRNMHGHCRPAQRGMVSAALREVFNAPDHAEARRRVGEVLDRLGAQVAQGLRAAGSRRGRPAGVHGVSRRALDQAALDQPAGARQPRDRPPHRRRRDLPQRRRRDPPRRRAADRAERRVARRSPLPLRRVDALAPDSADSADRSSLSIPIRRRSASSSPPEPRTSSPTSSYTTTRDLTCRSWASRNLARCLATGVLSRRD